MPRTHGTTDTQNTFLRAFISNPACPSPDAWPSPAVLRRCLRRPLFRLSLQSVRDTLRFQSDLHLAAAGAHASKSLEALAATARPTLDDKDQIANQNSKIKNAAALLRLAHLRERFAPADPPTRRPKHALLPEESLENLSAALKLLSLADPNQPVGEVCEFWLSRLDYSQTDENQK